MSESPLTDKERGELLSLLEIAKKQGLKKHFNPTVTGEIDSFVAQIISREPTYTASQVQEMKNAWVEEAMGRVIALGEVDSTARLIVNDAIFYPLKLVARAIKEMKE